MDCLLPHVLAALSGAPPVDARMVVAPPELRAPPSRRADGKGVYGANLPYNVDGAHFTVQWSDATIDPARAEALLGQLEAAWPVLVEEQGWPAPVSSDAWLLWVILDPELAGSGYTTVYVTDAYPDGYPVMYLNPDYYYAEEPGFGLSVAVHELGHMLQFRLRDWQAGSPDSWYWEATSEWLAERAAPNLDTYAYSTWWYAQWPDAAFDSLENYHPYGMVVLDAYLDERVFGVSGIRDTWLAAEGNLRPWDELIAEEAGRDFGDLVADMAAALAAGTLREGALYEPPVRAATHRTAPERAELDAPARYGSHFVDIGGGGEDLVVEGAVLARYVAEGVVTDAPPGGAYTLVLTGTGEGGAVVYGVAPAEPIETPEAEPEARGCGCGGEWGASGLGGMGLALALLRRRRPGAGSPKMQR